MINTAVESRKERRPEKEPTQRKSPQTRERRAARCCECSPQTQIPSTTRSQRVGGLHNSFYIIICYDCSVCVWVCVHVGTCSSFSVSLCAYSYVAVHFSISLLSLGVSYIIPCTHTYHRGELGWTRGGLRCTSLHWVPLPETRHDTGGAGLTFHYGLGKSEQDVQEKGGYIGNLTCYTTKIK